MIDKYPVVREARGSIGRGAAVGCPERRATALTWKCLHLREPSHIPWTPNDAERHTHKATTTALKVLWAKVANESLERTGNEGRAIREANAVVARQAETSG
jgi:hypothetical protein